MPDRTFFPCLSLLILFAAVPVFAQQQGFPGGVDEEQVVQPQEPEPPKQVLNVNVEDGRLSVEIANTSFGIAIRSIAEKAGFRVEGSGGVFNKKLNTKFANIEIERGVTRLLSLVNESNYMLHYKPGGSISSLEILPTTAGGSPAPGIRQPSRPQITPRPQPVQPPVQPPQAAPGESLQRKIPLPVQPSQPVTVRPRSIPRIPPSGRPTAPPMQPGIPQMLPEDEAAEEAVEEIPYMEPVPRQPQVTPRRR